MDWEKETPAASVLTRWPCHIQQGQEAAGRSGFVLLQELTQGNQIPHTVLVRRINLDNTVLCFGQKTCHFEGLKQRVSRSSQKSNVFRSIWCTKASLMHFHGCSYTVELHNLYIVCCLSRQTDFLRNSPHTDLLKRVVSSISSFSPFNFVMLLCFPSFRQAILVLRRTSVTAGSSLSCGSEEGSQRTLLFYRSAVCYWSRS